MPAERVERTPPGPWSAVLAVVLLFGLAGLGLILQEIPRDWPVPTTIHDVGAALFLAVWLIAAGGLGVGWVRGFPPWSFPYAGLALLMSLYMTQVSTPGLRIANEQVFGSELWRWRAWIPLALATGTALLCTRSFRPVGRSLVQVWEDWTLLSFAVFGWMPLLAAVILDGIERAYVLPVMVLETLLMCATAAGYLRASGQRQRVMVLVPGVVLCVAVPLVGQAVYWAAQGIQVWLQTVSATVVLVGILLSPALLGLPRWLRRESKGSGS